MKKILVTGSEGYIGSILVPMLIEAGYEISLNLKTLFSNRVRRITQLR